MNTRKVTLLVFAFLLLSVVLVACQPEEVEVTRVVEQEVEVTRVVTETEVVEGETVEVTRVVTEEVIVEVPAEVEEVMEEVVVTLNTYDTSDIPNLDPQLGEDVTTINYVENLFMALTKYDRATSEVVAEAATSWDVSDDGLQYTFHLRNDIPWVKYNPVTGETVQEIRFDDEGNEIGPAFLNANDFVYGIKRACDPNLGSYYSGIIANLIVGCSDVLHAEDPENVPQELIDAIGVSAPDEATVVIDLEFPAGYFLSMTPMWTIAATPQWAIEEHGDDWVEAGRIVTNGPYVLEEWIHDVRRSIVRNPLFPADIAGAGNIERWVTDVVPDPSTGYALWLANEVDRSGIPDAELQAQLEQFPDETVQESDLAVFYFGFNQGKAPFDNADVRRAFSAAFDRESYINDVRQGQGVPMTHFTPPGMFGAPPIDEIGIEFDPAAAAAFMEAAGYPNCEGFPPVSIVGYTGQNTLNWLEFAQANYAENLGCDPSIFNIEQLPFRELLQAYSEEVPLADSPNMFTAGWGPDYADANNWVGDVIWCENSPNDWRRPCGEVDDLIVEARLETDPERRIELYAQIEEMFFGPEGEVPFTPHYLRISFVANHDWYDREQDLFGGIQMYNNSIDMDAKLAAQGE